MKYKILQKLYDNKHITFNELLTLLDIDRPTIDGPSIDPITSASPHPYPYPYYPYYPYTITYSTKDTECVSDSYKTYDPKEYKEQR